MPLLSQDNFENQDPHQSAGVKNTLVPQIRKQKFNTRESLVNFHIKAFKSYVKKLKVKVKLSETLIKISINHILQYFITQNILIAPTHVIRSSLVF